MATMVAATVVIVFVLAMTKAGRDIDAATQRFMLFYAGVFALIGLTGSVMVGLVATDRIVMTPGHRVMAQAVHRAASFGALAFLVIHIVTEILAQRAHILDAFIPFLSPFRTFYIGLGTIASDLILLIVITSILRKRFTTHGKAWRWRAIHYSAYVAFVFGVLHGLLGGREAKPYVDWSYGFAIALVALGLAVRFLAISLRPQENLSSAPGADRPRVPGASPLHAAAMSMAQAQLGGTVQVLPAGMGARGAGFGAQGTGPWAALPATPAWSSPSGPLPLAALEAAPVYAESSSGAYPSYASAEAYPAESYRPAEAYRDLGFTPLGAPPYGDDAPVGFGGRPYVPADPPRPALPGSAGATGGRRPLYEPGYDGPPRFEGAPRGHVPQDELSSYPYDMPGRSQPAAGSAGGYVLSGDYANEASGPGRPRPNRAIEAPGPRSGQPAQGRPGDRNTGPTPRAGTGPMPRAGTGPMPRLDTGPMPRAGNGQPPRNGTGPMPRAGASPAPRADSGPMPRAGTGPMPRAGTGPMPRAGTGPMPRAGTGPVPRPDSGPIPGLGAGQVPQAGTGPMPRAGTGPMPRADSGPMPRAGTGPMARPDTGPMPRVGPGPASRVGPEPAARPDTGPAPRAPLTGPPGPPGPPAEPAPGPQAGRPPRAAAPTSHRKNSADPRYREVSGPTGGDEWR
jgi:DMSO/TMAO reductase YedYZ heme-binding membrane subunit